MKVIYAESCNCAEKDLCVEGFEPVWLDDEREAVRRHIDAEFKARQGGSIYFAFHAQGRHILGIALNR